MRGMPLVKMEMRKRHLTREEKKALFAAVHDALVATFKIAEHDRTQRLIEHDDGHFEIPPGHSDHYLVVEIDVFPGRSLETKRALYADIVARLEPIGIPPNDVLIVLRELPRENWGLRGGKAASDLDF